MLAAFKSWLRDTIYMPRLSWKKGERDAFKTASKTFNKFTTPIFTVPPAGDFDHEVGYIPAPAEHVRLFGPRLHDSRKNAPIFVDARYLDDERHKVEFNVHPLTALLERARLAGAQAWPVTAFGRSDEYQEAVAKAHLKHNVPVGVTVSLADFVSPNLAPTLLSVCNQVSCDAQDAVLMIDGGPLHFASEQEEKLFATLFAEKLSELPNLFEWAQIAFSATSLSDPQKMKAGEEKIIRRNEWHIHRLLVSNKQPIARLPIFSDYGVEYASSLIPRKARPTAKLSYTTPGGHFLVKGLNVKVGGYEAIYPVAKQVVTSFHYMGPDFSQGDARIRQWSEEVGGTGAAPTWKWAAVDHHFAVVGGDLSRECGIALPEMAPSTEPSDSPSLLPAK